VKKRPRVRKVLLTAVLISALLIASASVLLAHDRAMILIHPPRLPVTVFPESVGITAYENVQMRTSDGIDLNGWYIPPRDNPGAVLIYLHGLGGNRQKMLPLAAILCQHGYGALLIDSRNHGESGGSLTTLGYDEPLDAQAALDFLLTRPDVNAEQIGIVGVSLGAVTAIRAGAQIPQLRAVVAQAAFTSIEENVAVGVRQITGLPPFPFAPLVIFFGEQETGLSIRQVRPIDDIAQIAPRAVLLMHGEQDRLLAPDNSQRLYDAAAEPKELVYFPSSPHGSLTASDQVLWETRTVAFLDRYLRGME
jgi:dipeptidyl aminopeptidase/acylaminoacyl peptidase